MERTPPETKPPLWPLVVFAGTLSFLLVPLAIGSTGARLGAAGGGLGMVGGFVLTLRTVRREHEDDTQPPFLALARESTARSGRMFVYMAGYVLLVYLVALAPGSGSRRESGAAGLVVAALAGVLLVATLLDGRRISRSREGVERQVFLEATSAAFFVTVGAAVSYGMFEVFSDAPKLSMWVVWTVGMVAWGVSMAIVGRRAN